MGVAGLLHGVVLTGDPLPDPLQALLSNAAGPEVAAAVRALLDARDSVSFAAAEAALHAARRKESDEIVALALQVRVSDKALVEEARAAAHARAKEAGVRLHSKGTKQTVVRLLGGSVVSVAALMLLPATPDDPGQRRKRGQRGSAGAGVYPALAQLGIIDRATPALREAVARQVAASNSVEAARAALERQGILIDHKAALRLTYSFAESALAARNRAQREAPGPNLGEMAGRNIVVSMDGGRLRIKVPGRAGDSDRTFDADWREPKVLTIYAVGPDGRRDRKVKALIDATMGNADDVAALLVGHLRLLGAHHANRVTFIADGGSWIWARTEEIRRAAGVDPTRWFEQLDLMHTVEYLGRVIEPLGLDQIDRKSWLAEQKVSLLRGDLDEVLFALAILGREHPNLTCETARKFLELHRTRLCFLFCRSDGQPMGSGGVESAVRRVVNLRLKGNSIYWTEEHAEAILHLRSHLVTGRWGDLVGRTLREPTWTPKRAAA